MAGGKTKSASKVKTTKRRSTKATAKRPKRAVKRVVKPRRVRTAVPIPVTLPKPIAVTSLAPKPPSRFKLEALVDHLLNITIVVASGVIGAVTILGYANVTNTIIQTSQTAATVTNPVQLIEQTFPITAGQLTVRFPKQWQLNDITTETIGWDVVQIHLYQTDQTTVLDWLKQANIAYQLRRVIDPLPAVQLRHGLSIVGTTSDTTPMTAHYFISHGRVIEIIVQHSVLPNLVDQFITTMTITNEDGE
ncbi:MAG: DUF2462 domain-containing protein [Candidatus Kerfeldbacteria bacterium]|nr:DUF2462 domain-containing protein [Candidatus Kerfeldbacteria bacterium]